jgi:integral membrane protein
MSFLQWLRRVSLVEGISTLVLFGVAMPLKYFAGMPAAVTLVGTIHGVLFTGLAFLLLLAIWKVPIPVRVAALGLFAAVFPGGPFLFDRTLRRYEGIRQPGR